MFQFSSSQLNVGGVLLVGNVSAVPVSAFACNSSRHVVSQLNSAIRTTPAIEATTAIAAEAFSCVLLKMRDSPMLSHWKILSFNCRSAGVGIYVRELAERCGKDKRLWFGLLPRIARV